MDGGIRRGTDILKALALGTRAVLVGRPDSLGADRGWRTRHPARAGDPAYRTGTSDNAGRLSPTLASINRSLVK